jgi:hypothetical protein
MLERAALVRRTTAPMSGIRAVCRSDPRQWSAGAKKKRRNSALEHE